MAERSITDQLKDIHASNLNDLQKVTQAYNLITSTILLHSDNEIELRRAMSDQENLVKEQIKNGMIKHLRSIYNTCHQQATGRKAWDD